MAVTDRETNDNFARHNPQFRAACERAGVKPTKRQASKYRRGVGAAYAARVVLIQTVPVWGAA